MVDLHFYQKHIISVFTTSWSIQAVSSSYEISTGIGFCQTKFKISCIQVLY